MTSTTKPAVHYISLQHKWRTEPQPQATCTKNLVNFDYVVFQWR